MRGAEACARARCIPVTVQCRHGGRKGQGTLGRVRPRSQASRCGLRVDSRRGFPAPGLQRRRSHPPAEHGRTTPTSRSFGPRLALQPEADAGEGGSGANSQPAGPLRCGAIRHTVDRRAGATGGFFLAKIHGLPSASVNRFDRSPGAGNFQQQPRPCIFSSMPGTGNGNRK